MRFVTPRTRPSLHMSSRSFSLWLAIPLSLAIGLPARAWADASPQAEALFRDGKQLIKDGKIAEACQAFEGSERAEHNVATLLSLADCREKNRQYAAAWALFLQADSQTRGEPAKAALNRTAKTRALALEPKLSYLTINVPDESRVPELVVLRDGQPVDPAEWNRAIPADGGSHTVSGKAPGHESWQTTVILKPELDKQAVEVPKFKALPAIVLKPQALRSEHPEADADADAPAPAPSPFTTRRKIGLGVAGGGVVIAAVAIGLGVSAQSLRDDAVASCPATACTTDGAASAQHKNDSARSRAMIANVGFGVAGAAVIAGAVLWLTGKPESPSAPQVSIAPQVGATSGLAVVGSF